MTKETHVKGGYILALLLLPYIYNTYIIEYNFFYRVILLFIYAYFTNIGSLACDIDMKGSYISKRFPIIYKIFGKRLRHRGFTHSLVFLAFLMYFFNSILICSDFNIAFLCLFSGFIIGILSHIILDLLTKEGVELFYPIETNFSVLPIKTSSRTEKNICKLLNILVVFLIGYRFYLFTL
ncbi:metal-dependent hydrolase [Terrisporobacter sp.]|uniref:metal-dependent hydrolase n=1 Tax=Terrisporobacter sp. TaxID=1965305 RepID=UPI00261F6CD5|nr:metal-dependent hydrolase [Terrisporobacter sp.]